MTIAIDPRTLREIKEAADCHLIPQCFNVSNVTVSLDRKIDSLIGAVCDAALQTYFKFQFGRQMSGKLTVDGGSPNLPAVLDIQDNRLVIPKPPSSPVAGFIDRALGLENGQFDWQEFRTEPIDQCAAYLSAIHSGFLVLYQKESSIVFAKDFDWVATGRGAIPI